jgi:hypothetical protein
MPDREDAFPSVRWSFDPSNPVIAPGQLNPQHDSRRAGSAHVLQIGDWYRIYYWGTGEDGRHSICVARSPVDDPNRWEPMGGVLGPQEETQYNCVGPGFPFVVPVPGGQWLMYFGAWGKRQEGKGLPNTTGLALSDDEGLTWRYWGDHPVLPLDRPWDREGTGSVCVLHEDGLFRMYYTSLGPYKPRPEGAQTGHGDVIPHIGVGYAESRDGIMWEKPLDDLLISPRGFDTEPYEYICSKPFVVREPGGYRMWVNTFGTAYRVRNLTSTDGLSWSWVESGPEGDFGVGPEGAFDSKQRCYACVVKHGEEYRCWYTGDMFGQTGTGYATGTNAIRG